MIKKIILTLLFLNLSSLFAVNDITLKLGSLFTADRELIWSPVLTNTLSPLGEISYKVGSDRGFHSINTFFSMGTISSPISDYRLYIKEEGTTYTRDDTLIMSHIEYNYYHKGLSLNGLSVYFGPGLEMDFQMVLGYYVHANVATCLNLGTYMEKVINRHSFSASFTIPVITYLNRPPYTGTDDIVMDMASSDIGGLLTRGYFTSLNEYLNLDFEFNYQYRINQRLKFNTGLNLAYTWIKSPREKWLLDSSLFVGITYSFEGGNND